MTRSEWKKIMERLAERYMEMWGCLCKPHNRLMAGFDANPQCGACGGYIVARRANG